MASECRKMEENFQHKSTMSTKISKPKNRIRKEKIDKLRPDLKSSRSHPEPNKTEFLRLNLKDSNALKCKLRAHSDCTG